MSRQSDTPSQEGMWKDIVYGVQHDVFTDPIAKAALRAYQLGVCDEEIAGMGTKRAITLRRSLVEQGLLREHTVATGARGRNAIVLELTGKAQDAFGRDGKDSNKAWLWMSTEPGQTHYNSKPVIIVLTTS